MPPRQAIAAFFAEIIERSLADPQRKGCMLVNTALEMAPHDPEFQRVVVDVMVQVEGFFRRCVVAGQRDGTISKSQSAEDLARLLLSTLLGLRVLARTRPERELLEGGVTARPLAARQRTLSEGASREMIGSDCSRAFSQSHSRSAER